MGSSKSDEIRAKKYFLGEIGNSPLVNKLDIDNQQELDEAEAYFVENALANGLSEKAKELPPNGLKQIHKELFGELYTWDGFSLNTNLLDKDRWYKSAEECHIYAKYDGFENIKSLSKLKINSYKHKG